MRQAGDVMQTRDIDACADRTDRPVATAACKTGSAAPRVAARNVLVAIPVLNEAAHISDCLTSLFADPWLCGARVVVADGGSTDDTCAIVRAMVADHPALSLIHNPGRLQSAAINAVIRECADEDTRFLVRCDAHATYPPRFVARVTQALSAWPDAASIVTPMDATGQGCFQRAAAWVADTPLGSGGSAHRGGSRSGWVDHGHHAGFRIAWFRRIGGYDESFSHNEDAEFDRRLTQAGGRIRLDADIRLDYRMRPTLAGLARQYWNYGRGRARTVRKHRMRPRLRQIVPALNFAGLGIALALAPVWPWFLVFPALYASVLVAVSCVAVARLRTPCGLWAGVALGAMHNFWGAGFMWQVIAGTPAR